MPGYRNPHEGRFTRRWTSRSSYRRAMEEPYLRSGCISRVYGPGDETTEKDKDGPLMVKHVDYNIHKNTHAHHTEKYELTERHFMDGRWVDPQLVIRRGQVFSITLSFQRPYNDNTDDVLLIFGFGDEPNEYKGSSVRFLVSAADLPKQWQAKITRVSGNQIDLEINTPPDCAVGEWDFLIETVAKQGGKKKTYKYMHTENVYILFNAWCKDDAVYMEDEVLRNEYVLNDTGRVYQGTAKNIAGKPWNFGQFEDFVLKCVVWLMDNKSQLGFRYRGDPVKLVRRISAFVNDCDDNGVLQGNWSGDYAGGTRPTKWVGSVKILEQYWKTKQPVLYGQCWVFSGVVNTVCRALGIPTRSVTNFASAHDSDGSITIDQFWTSAMTPDNDMHGDSVWNFHVWNESWMKRPDLPAGCGGWQAFDATPQETSEGIYCAGPASLNAIKQGICTSNYDAPFIFAEVNGDRIHWVAQPDNPERRKIIQKNVIGKNISTHKPKVLQKHVFDDREDITGQYKYPEGSEEERSAVWRAAAASTKPTQVYETGPEDVSFELVDKEFASYGKPFDVEVKVKNNSKESRKVVLNVNVTAVKYTGVCGKQVKHQDYNFQLKAGEETKKSFVVTPAEYLGKLMEQFNMKMTVHGSVIETRQQVCQEDDFRLRRPGITIEVKGNPKVGETLDCEAFFSNPLEKVTLTDCSFTVEGPGLQKPVDIDCKDVPGGSEARIKFQLVPKKPGDREIITSFDCHELPDINGSFVVKVASK